MSLGMTICFYLLIGIAVTAALWLSRDTSDGASDLFQILTAPFFWPIYLPLVLVRRSEQINPSKESIDDSRSPTDADPMATAIGQVERELDAALQSLGGWAESVLSDEQHRIAELKHAWRQQADHIRELDKLLTQSSLDSAPSTADGNSAPPSDRGPSGKTTEHERFRSENIVRLKEVRAGLYDDLMSTVAWVRELVTMIHLAKYTGAPASRAEELVRQIAAVVEGLSDASRMSSSTQA